jgi:hypothetical protein
VLTLSKKHRYMFAGGMALLAAAMTAAPAHATIPACQVNIEDARQFLRSVHALMVGLPVEMRVKVLQAYHDQIVESGRDPALVARIYAVQKLDGSILLLLASDADCFLMHLHLSAEEFTEVLATGAMPGG